MGFEPDFRMESLKKWDKLKANVSVGDRWYGDAEGTRLTILVSKLMKF
jgi:hypothetical protein